MRRDIETFAELLTALSEPKSTISSACRLTGISEATVHRWKAASRADPESFTFEFDGETAPLHVHMRRAARLGYARYLAGDRPAPRPLRHRPRPAPELFEDDDPTADAPHAAEPSVTVTDAAPEPVQVETALTRDLRQRLEARKDGTILPPIVPVRGAAPSPRYISPEEKSEGIGKGTVREGGMKVA